MYFFDMTNITTLVLLIIATVLLMFLSKEIKNSKVALATLVAFVLSLIIHTVQLITLDAQYEYLYGTLFVNIAIDYVFVLITFLAYIWADDIEAQEGKKKVVKNSGIEWLFKKV